MKVWAAKVTSQVEAVVGPYKLYDTSFHSLRGTEWLSDEVRLKLKKKVFILMLWVAVVLFGCLSKWLINPEPDSMSHTIIKVELFSTKTKFISIHVYFS